MNRLTKAEFFRFIHSGVCFRVLLMCCVALGFFPLAQNIDFMSKNLSENLPNIGTGFMMFTMFIPLLVTIAVANNYTRKTAYYEVMAGNKIGHIIGNKLLVEGVFIGVLVFMALTAPGVIIAMKNGMGVVNRLGTRVFLLFVICLHVTFVSVLIGMLVKNIVGAMVSYLRFSIIELMIEMVLPMLEIKKVFSVELCEVIRKTFLMNQIVGTLEIEIANNNINWVMGTFVVEVLFWYLLVYYTMKKKMYK